MAGIAPVPGLSLYSASKFATRAFSICAAKDLAPKGVYVSVVCPDAIETAMLTKQIPFEAAAMTFSGNRVLTTDDLNDCVIRDVLVNRPRERVLAVDGTRAVLAPLGAIFHNTKFMAWFERDIVKKGAGNQKAYRKKE